MPLPKCIVCGTPLERPYIRSTFVGKPGSRLDGITFEACAGCISMQFPLPGKPLPPRIPDPVAEPTETEWRRTA